MPAAATKSLQQLREERDNLKKEVLELRKSFDENKAAGKKGDELWGGADKRTRFDQIESRKKELDAEIKDIEGEERLKQLDFEERNDPTPPRFTNGINHEREEFEQRREDHRLCLRSWAMQGVPGVATDKRAIEACQRMEFNPNTPSLAMEFRDDYAYRQLRSAFAQGTHQELVEKRALSALSPAAGGLTIGVTLVDQIEVNMLFFGQMEQISDLILTDGGEEMGWPTMDDTTNEGEMLGENQATSTTEDPTFGQVKWHAFEFSSKLVKVPRSALQDSHRLEGTLGNALGLRVARSFNRKCTVGVGGNQPRGYLIAASSGKTTASPTAFTRPEIVDLIHSINQSYRTPGCRLVMNDLILSELRKLQDSQNRPLDLVTYDNDGTPRFRDGNYKIALNDHMDSALAANNKTVAFGDFSKGKIRRVRGIVVSRLVERYAEANQLGFLTIVRQDYNVLDAGTDPIKYLTQHS